MNSDDPSLTGGAYSSSLSAALSRAREVGLAELRRKPRAVSWRREAFGTVVAVLSITALVAGVGAWLSIIEMDRLRERAIPLVLLVILQGLGAYAAIAPGRASLRFAVGVLAVAAAVTVIAGRGAGHSPGTPSVFCSASHIGVDLIPLGMVLLALQRFSWTFGRALLAGAATAATGAIAGELSCGRGWTHALVHHVGAGLLITVVCLVLSRARRPQTFAP